MNSDGVGSAVVAGVRDLLPVLRERAQETEDTRVVPAESVKVMPIDVVSKVRVVLVVLLNGRVTGPVNVRQSA